MILVSIDPSHAPAGAPAFVERAMKTWTDAAAGRFTLKKAARTDTAALRVRFVSSDALFGEALPRVDPRIGAIVSAEVAINGDVAGDALQQRLIVYLTALHELGHALGLPHTDEFDTIVYSFRRPDDGARYFGASAALAIRLSTRRSRRDSPTSQRCARCMIDRSLKSSQAISVKPLTEFHPIVARWFADNIGEPTDAQRRGWAAIREGRHTLIAAPTGSGKTLAAFLTALDDLFQEGLRGPLRT